MDQSDSTKTNTPINIRNEERRAAKRRALKFRVVIRHKRLCFRSYTRDISNGGLRLANKVPKDFIGVSCQIFIGSDDSRENIEFTGKVFDDPENPLRVQFEAATEKNSIRLAEWLQAHASS